METGAFPLFVSGNACSALQHAWNPVYVFSKHVVCVFAVQRSGQPREDHRVPTDAVWRLVPAGLRNTHTHSRSFSHVTLWEVSACLIYWSCFICYCRSWTLNRMTWEDVYTLSSEERRDWTTEALLGMTRTGNQISTVQNAHVWTAVLLAIMCQWFENRLQEFCAVCECRIISGSAEFSSLLTSKTFD